MNLHEWVLNHSPDAVIFANKVGDIELWNPAAEVIFGFTAEEMLGKNLDLIIPERYRKTHWNAFYRALEMGHTQYHRPLVTRSLHKSRDPFYVDMSFSVVKNNLKEVIGAMACARDVTEKYLKEKKLNSKP